MTKYFRTLSSDYPRLTYSDTNYSSLSCHWGQRKLMYSEIEYFTILSNYLSKDKSLIVYIGAATGEHMDYYKILFPDIEMILYDPNPFKLDKTNKMFIIKNEFFTDESIQEISLIAKGRNIIFISDIRSQTDDEWEELVWENMIKQQEWGIKLNAKYMLLKFRLPFPNDKKSENYSYNTDEIKDVISVNNKNKETNKLLYLSGKRIFQIYAKNRSTETRLFVKRRNNKYELEYYNNKTYEEQMNYFNQIDRLKNYKYKQSDDIYNHILSYTNTYDNTGEYYIIYKYLKYYKRETENIHEKTIKLVSQINYFLNKLNKNSLILCNIHSINIKYKKDIEMLKKKVKEECNKLNNKLTNQLQIIRTSKILSENDVNKMIQIENNKKLIYKNIYSIVINSNTNTINLKIELK